MVHVLINDGALGSVCAYHIISHDKLLTALKFDGASTMSYVLIVTWPQYEL